MKSFYRIIASIFVGVAFISSCSTSTYNEQEAENQQKRELIVGKWACRLPGTYSGYELYVFRADGTGIFGYYDDPLVNQNPTLHTSDSFRYAIFNSEIAFCYDYWNHDHPMIPGAICDSGNPLRFIEFTIDETTMHIMDGSFPFTRVAQWSDVGLPDDLLPE